MRFPVTLFARGRRARAVRIPAIAALDDRRIVAMAVRRWRISDLGPSDLLLRRSDDGGATWSPLAVIQRGWWRTVDNPTLVAADGRLHLLFQVGYRRLLHRVSDDGGRSFGPAVDLTGVVREAGRPGFRPVTIAPGPGSGAVLPGGRLVVPVWMAASARHRPSATGTIVSDDGGSTWRAGDLVAGPGGRFPNPTEATVAPVGDGVLLGFRQRRTDRRVFARSPDGAGEWSPPFEAAELFEPGSHAALASVPSASGGRLVFANPDSRNSPAAALPDGKRARERLTLRWSDDDGRSWGPAELVDAGPSGYVALAADPTGALHILWERGRLRGTGLWPTSIGYLRRDAAGEPHASEDSDGAPGGPGTPS